MADDMLKAMNYPQAVIDVIEERRRQVCAEGWTARHDDEHGDGSMALAAACYACNAATWAKRDVSLLDADYVRLATPGFRWPWAQKWWKPKSQRRDLVRAAALLLAEIERLDRAALPFNATGVPGLIPTPARRPAMPPVQPPRSDPQSPPIGIGCCGGEPNCDTLNECAAGVPDAAALLRDLVNAIEEYENVEGIDNGAHRKRRDAAFAKAQAYTSGVIDCEGTGPCSTCPDRRECGRSGCVRIAQRRKAMNADAGSAAVGGVRDRFGNADLAPGKHGGTLAVMPSGVQEPQPSRKAP